MITKIPLTKNHCYNLSTMKKLFIITLTFNILFILFLTSCVKENIDELQISQLMWVEKYLPSFLYILLGGFLGFLGTLWNQIINQRRRREIFKKRLYVEFKFVLPILIAMHYSLSTSVGDFSRDVLVWAFSMGKKYSVFKKETIDRWKKLLDKEDEVFFKEAAEYYRDNETIGKTIKKVNIPVLQTDNYILTMFKDKYQLEVLAIYRDVQVINEEVEFYYFNFKKSFDSNISSQNYKIVNKNMNLGYRNISKISKHIADRMSSFIDEYY